MRSVLLALPLTASLALAAPCAAEEARPRRYHASVALLSGYGLQLDSVLSSGLSAYRFGFGTRAGLTAPCGAYLGGTFVTHLGTSVAGTRDGASVLVSTARATYVGPEIGFDFALWNLLLRPYVGTGLLVVVSKTALGSSGFDDNRALYYVAPGGLVAYRRGELLLGVDLRIPIVPAQSTNKWAPAAMLTAGMRY